MGSVPVYRLYQTANSSRRLNPQRSARDSVSSRLYGRVDLPLLVQSPRFNLDPSTEAKIVEYMRERNERGMNLPEVCRPLMPDHQRVVHMAALLACIGDPQEPDTIAASTYMAMAR